MRCRYCFAAFDDVRRSVLPRGHLPEVGAIEVVDALAARFEKVTFAGGEPTLCPWLLPLVQRAHAAGAVTMLVTNGTAIDGGWLDLFAGSLDWLTLSVDSASPEVNRAVGRAVSGRPIPVERHVEVAREARARGMRLKVNTVVTRLNAAEDMAAALEALAPERWKIFQALRVVGQNDDGYRDVACEAAEFERFIQRHAHLARKGIAVVPEDNTAMRGSYAMVDPAGRFYDNVDGGHRYSRPILDVGIDVAWSDVKFSAARFDERGGRYDYASPAVRRLPVSRG